MKKFLLPLFIILLGIAIASFLCAVLLFGIQADSQCFTANKKALVNLEANFENHKNLENIFHDKAMDFEKIESHFIEQEAPIHFFEFLEDRARHCSLSIEISSLSESARESKENSDKDIRLQIKLQGAEQDFMKFLDQIEASHYLLEVIGLNLKKIGKESSEAISALLTIKIFVK